MIKIFPMQQCHAQQVCNIGNECFSMPWSLNGIKAELVNPHAITFVAVKDDFVIGYINVHCAFEEGYINTIAVKIDNRRQGIGRLLLNHLFDYGRNHAIDFFTLEVRRSNEKAIRFYESFGFVKIGQRKNMYENPVEDALLFTKASVTNNKTKKDV